MAKRTVIYLFRNDLRLHDNECLAWAHRNAEHVLPLYCFDPSHYKKTYQYELPKTNKFRAKFLIECVQDLRSNLKRKGSNLIVRRETPTEAVKKLIEQCKQSAPVKALVYQKEVTKEEVDVENSLVELCKGLSIEVQTFWGLTLYHPEDIPYENYKVPDVYTAYRKKTENHARVRPAIDEPEVYKPLPSVKEGKIGDIPTLTDLGLEAFNTHPKSAFPFEGGETSGLKRIDEYFWGSNSVSKYKETRNGLLGMEYSTKFSPWLASGSLSPREVYHKLSKYEKEKVKNDSTYWVIFELMWRDYFKFVAVKYGNKMFFPGGLKGKKIEWKYDKKIMAAWMKGETGIPFVDANMKELILTGWMSNRGRQNVASFLVKDLQIDWRLGAEFFESYLLDHDVCSNYGNWNYAAGIGNDPRVYRKFNMIKQGKDYDPDGEYIKTWVPELLSVSDDRIHTPWLYLKKPVNYPEPIHIAPEWERHYPKGSKKSVPDAKRQKKGMDFYFKSGAAQK